MLIHINLSLIHISLIRNVDCVYGFRRHQNQISMMHIDKGDYLKLMEGEHGQGEPETVK